MVNSSLAPVFYVAVSGRRLDAEFPVDLREVARTVGAKQDKVVDFAVGKDEADRGSLGRGFLLQHNNIGSE
ncbi:Uncharacterised protein [Mycobacterium tuberculosis]|nr:Uncharacterised protein [Mycobacterium tuberculosis]